VVDSLPTPSQTATVFQKTGEQIAIAIAIAPGWLVARLQLDWTGLDWTGLDWTGLDWTGLDWTGLGWTWIVLHCTALHWTRLDCTTTRRLSLAGDRAHLETAAAADRPKVELDRVPSTFMHL